METKLYDNLDVIHCLLNWTLSVLLAPPTETEAWPVVIKSNMPTNCFSLKKQNKILYLSVFPHLILITRSSWVYVMQDGH